MSQVSAEQQQLDVAAYHAVVATNYLAQTNVTLNGTAEWPPGQALLPTPDAPADASLLPIMTCTLSGAWLFCAWNQQQRCSST